jgi:hypothetical protein
VAKYSTTQSVHCFTFTVGSAADLVFDNQGVDGLAAMQAYVQSVATTMLAKPEVQLLIGSDWIAVWGPVVYSRDTTGPTVVADNTMACYFNLKQNTFVVAVAGTNPRSPFDWFGQDFDVHTQIPWTTAGGSGGGNISAGANNGLQIVLALRDASGQTMLEALSHFLEERQIAEATIAVGGHSLGGALSPCLALYMFENAMKLGLSGQKLSVFATAGPTPGDATWASNYDTLISSKHISYSSLYNTLDVVPLAWQPTDLETIPTLYDSLLSPKDTPKDDFTGMLVSGAQLYALNSSDVNTYTQVANGRASLVGQFNTKLNTPLKLALETGLKKLLPGELALYGLSLTNAACFVAQAAAQHISAYPPLLLISEYYAQYKDALAACKPKWVTEIDPIKAAVLKTTGIDLDRVAAAGEAAAKPDA